MKEILGYILFFLGMLIAAFAGIMVFIKILKNKIAQQGFIRSRVRYPEWLVIGIIGATLATIGQAILGIL